MAEGEDYDEQLARERSQRDAALGRRFESVDRGNFGPALRRWVSGSIVPVAGLLRNSASALLSGNGVEAALKLHSPVFGMPQIRRPGANQRAILEWLLRGTSTATGDGGTYCEDIVLASLGTAVTALAQAKKPIPLTRLLNQCASAARETVLGQFITTVQGASSMERVRKSGKEHTWQERKSMDAIAALMSGQVRSALDAKDPPVKVGSREVVEVLTPKGEIRKISLRRPTKGDWLVLDLARLPKGTADAAKGDWISLTMLILCAAQAEAGWFDLVNVHTDTHRGKIKQNSKALVLSEAASENIAKDVAKWLQMGFIKEPMLTAPLDGDYLSVKHRAVLGGRGPMGHKTDAKGSTAWDNACAVLAATPWRVTDDTLRAVRENRYGLGDAAAKQFPHAGQRELILGSYGRAGGNRDIYFPIAMDFRGRVYLQTPMVTYQGKDLQKGLLTFNSDIVRGARNCNEVWSHILPMHIANLVGKPYDKAPLAEKQALFNERMHTPGSSLEPYVREAEDPVQFYTAWDLIRRGQWDSIPVQIDGTCNGLQHLTALFRDETAAPFVNLTRSGYDERSGDIYAEVARRVLARLGALPYGWSRRVLATVSIDRKLCKGPVMVLPYGGTLRSIQDAVLAAMAEQFQDVPKKVIFGGQLVEPWHECLHPGNEVRGACWGRSEEEVQGGYLAFRDRELKDHPLFHLDARRLGTLVWECIEEVLPRPIAAMEAFRAIAKAAGDRTIEWSTGYEPNPLWVIQAKAKSERHTLRFKGYHLPGSVRGLSIRQGSDEVDPRAHTSGIVANFIHSQDADHLARTMGRHGSLPFGANHDCFITRPSLMAKLGHDTRRTFEEKYSDGGHPLRQPMRFRSLEGKTEEHADWFACAKAYGIAFPDFGTWKPEEVSQNPWFFS